MKFHLFPRPDHRIGRELSYEWFDYAAYHQAAMLTRAGHDVIWYGVAGSEIPGVEFVEVAAEPSAIAWQEMYRRGRAELAAHYQPGDLTLLSFGEWQELIPPRGMVGIEYVVGYDYPTSAAHVRVFPSRAWQHFVYGRQGNYRPSRCDAVIPGYIDAADYADLPCKRDKYLLFVGRLESCKGLYVAAAVARQTGRKLIVVGRAERSDVTTWLKGQSHIETTGWVTWRERNRLMAQAHALLAPSLYPEPFALVVAEAASAGCPVLAPDWGAFPESIKSGETGYICRTDADWRAAVERAADIDPEQCRLWAAEKFSLDAVWPKYEAVYRQAMNQFWGRAYQLNQRKTLQECSA